MAAESFTSARKTIFLDRDGVINRCAAPHMYIRTWEEFDFLPGAAEGIHLLNQAGYRVVVVSNQRGIARGLMTMDDVNEIHQKMCGELEKAGATIDSVCVCPHEIGTCHCRKPDIGLFLQAEQDCPVDKDVSWMIGDSKSDIQAGIRYGIKTILIGQGALDQSMSCESLLEAAQTILGDNR